MGYVMAITISFCIGDIDSVIETPTGFPFIQVFYNATKNYGATNTMAAIVIFNITQSAMQFLATSSRQLWSFARDKGLPFSDFFAHVGFSTLLDLLAG